MGLVDHQWALVRARRSGLGSFLDLAAALGGEPDADVLMALHRPLGFLADCLVPDAAPSCEAPFRRWIEACFGGPFAALGWDPARGEKEPQRMRRAALLGIVGSIAGSEDVLDQAARRCDRYLADRRAIDANLERRRSNAASCSPWAPFAIPSWWTEASRSRSPTPSPPRTSSSCWCGCSRTPPHANAPGLSSGGAGSASASACHRCWRAA
jgi:hypothetical protein